MLPKFEVDNVCFSCSPPDLNSSQIGPFTTVEATYFFVQIIPKLFSSLKSSKTDIYHFILNGTSLSSSSGLLGQNYGQWTMSRKYPGIRRLEGLTAMKIHNLYHDVGYDTV
jgi:hypothetical protein